MRVCIHAAGGRNPLCHVCGDHPIVTECLVDYEDFCQTCASDAAEASGLTVLPPEQRITPARYATLLATGAPHVLLDVRPAVQCGICSLPGTVNVPLGALMANEAEQRRVLDMAAGARLVVVCRRGNDSQLVVQQLQRLLHRAQSGSESGGGACGEVQPGREVKGAITFQVAPIDIVDIAGGLAGWSELHPEFPLY